MTIAILTYYPTLITAPKISTDLLWQLSFLFIGLGVLYILAVFYYRNRLTAQSRKVKEQKKLLSPMICEFIFHENEASKNEKSDYVNLKIEVRELIKDKFNRTILSEVLLDLIKDVSGEAQKNIFRLYQELNLHIDAFEHLKSWRWERVSKATLDLTHMQVIDAYGFITKFINDKRPTIRKQAEIAAVTLKPEGLNYFLDNTKYKISEWQQLKLMEVIRNQENYKPPKFKAWLTASNSDVVLFALRLIKHYNQNDANSSIIELVKHKNIQIKNEAIACIKEFHITEALETLIAIFWKNSTDIKIAILDTIANIGTKNELGFLYSIENHESNFSVKSKVWSTINTIAPDSIMPSKDIENNIQIEKINSTKEEVSTKHDNISVKEETLTDDNLSALTKDDNTIEQENNKTTKTDLLLNHNFLPTIIGERKKEESKDSNPKQPSNASNSNTPISPENVPYSESIEELDLLFKYQNHLKNISENIFSEDVLSFLPIVSSDEKQKNISIMCKKTNETNQSDKDRLHFKTEQTFSNQEDKVTKNTLNLDHLDYTFYNRTDIREIETIYEELLFKKNIYSIEVNDPEIVAFHTDADINSVSNAISNTTSSKMNADDAKKFKKIIDDLINFENNSKTEKESENVDSSSFLEFDKEKIDISFIPIINDETEVSSKKDLPTSKESSNSTDATKDNEALITYNSEIDSKESTMQLLDDLEEMGDHREVVLLKEMLVNVKYKTVQSRVQNLLTRFSGEESEPITETKSKTDFILRPFNVFEDLFRTSDTESKLILLNEIVAVGDASEISFLEQLLFDDNIIIKQEAARALEELKIKINNSKEQHTTENFSLVSPAINNDRSLLNEEPTEYAILMQDLAIEPSFEKSGIFDIAFEITENTSDEDITVAKKSEKDTQGSFINQVCTFSNKIIKKFNG